MRGKANKLIDIWGRIDVRGPDECWPWIGKSTNGAGYGNFRFELVYYTAHRVVAFLSGIITSLTEAVQVRHSCDNRPCCNPKHLLRGDAQGVANMQDCVARGRTNKPKGSANWRATLMEADVLSMRRRFADGEATRRQLAEEYGVSRVTIQKIIRREKWGHLPDEAVSTLATNLPAHVAANPIARRGSP